MTAPPGHRFSLRIAVLPFSAKGLSLGLITSCGGTLTLLSKRCCYDHFDQINRRVPVLTNVQPIGSYPSEWLNSLFPQGTEPCSNVRLFDSESGRRPQNESLGGIWRKVH